MKTLQEIKDEVAKEKGATGWNKLMSVYVFIEEVQRFNDEVAKRFAIEVAKEALRNADKRVGMFPNYRNLIQDKILNESNIPKL